VIQANVYDATRKRLLQGREDMLAILAAKLQNRATSTGSGKPVWYDIGGGTGYNIEVMDKLVGIEGFYEHVFLVDLSPSLCEVARERVGEHGWKNVTVLCQDARSIACAASSADLITMSYSLSMIPDYYSVVDMITNLLAPSGLVGICDFYVQSIVDVSSRNYIGGTFNRHVNWVGRMFWRTWFDADRVNLDGGRRDYVEYRFGTILSASERNYLLGG
jgi:betaine lipid synthase